MDRLSNLQDNVAEVQTALSRLATRDYVDEQVRGVNQRIQDSKATTQLANFAKVAASITALVAFFAMTYEVIGSVKDMRAIVQATKK